jgi:hypothetical protein
MENRQPKRPELVLKFFIKTPKTPRYTSYYIGIGVFLLGLLVSTTQRGIPAAFLTLGCFIGLIIVLRNWYVRHRDYTAAYKKAEPKATDQQMDDWLRQGTDDVIKAARKRLDIDEDDISAVPMIIDGPTNDSYIAPGTDRVLRFKRHNMLLIFLTDHNVATFQCIYDLGPGEIFEDKTKEFPYKDITNLETHTSNHMFYYLNDQKVAIKGAQTLNIYTSGGNVISVNYIYEKKTTEDPDDYIYPVSTGETTIRAIRKRLKEYKDRFSSESRQGQN